MNKVTLEAVFRTKQETPYGETDKVAIKIKEEKIGDVSLDDRWISALGTKRVQGTEKWEKGQEVMINFIVTEKGYLNFELPDEKDAKIAELEAQASATTEESGDDTEDVNPDDVDF